MSSYNHFLVSGAKHCFGFWKDFKNVLKLNPSKDDSNSIHGLPMEQQVNVTFVHFNASIRTMLVESVRDR